MKRLILVAALLLLFLAALLVGGARHRWLEVESGEYTQVRGTDEASRAVARHIRSLYIDREAATATLALDDGSQIRLSFLARERSEWPEGCPTNILQHHMEVLDAEESNLTIASMTLQEPVLVRNCPRDPQEIVLREDGPMGDAGSAQSDSCLVFAREGTRRSDVVYLGQYEGAGYTLLHWQDRPSLMFWYDEPASARCQTHSTGEEIYGATCSAQPAAGRQVAWEVTTGDEGQATVTVDGKAYDLDQGRLFLLTTRGETTRVLQLGRDLSTVEPDQDAIMTFARTVPEIMELIERTSDPAGALPPSLPHFEKGYELYSWQGGDDGLWRYTLVTGTDRLKTADEITSGGDKVSDAGCVKVTVTGEDALYALLDLLPAGEQVFWCSEESLLAEGAEAGQFRLPPGGIVVAVSERARELGLGLTVAAEGATTEPDQGEQPKTELEALLELPHTLPDGERVPVTFTLINHAAYALHILNWYTPLEGIAGEIFRVQRDGQALLYQGILAMRAGPRPQDYVHLAPGTSATAVVDLAQAYDFSQAGTYTVRFLSPRISHVARAEAEFAETVDELGPVPMPSNTVTVTVGTGE